MTIDASLSGARNATLADLAALLRDQQARKVDIVAPASCDPRQRAGSWSSMTPRRNSARTGSR